MMSETEQNVVVKSDGKTPTEVVFEWKGLHNVYQLPSKAALDKCDFSEAKELSSTSPYTFKASSVGTYYFSCEIGAHCQFGQKLQLKVTGVCLCVCVCVCVCMRMSVFCSLQMLSIHCCNQRFLLLP